MNEIKYIEFFTVILSDGSENAPIIFVHDRMKNYPSKLKVFFWVKITLRRLI